MGPTEQPDLKGMPDKNELGDAAEKFIDIRERRMEITDELKRAEKELISKFKESKQTSFTANGVTLGLQHKSALDKITVNNKDASHTRD